MLNLHWHNVTSNQVIFVILQNKQNFIFSICNHLCHQSTLYSIKIPAFIKEKNPFGAQFFWHCTSLVHSLNMFRIKSQNLNSPSNDLFVSRFIFPQYVCWQQLGSLTKVKKFFPTMYICFVLVNYRGRVQAVQAVTSNVIVRPSVIYLAQAKCLH